MKDPNEHIKMRIKEYILERYSFAGRLGLPYKRLPMLSVYMRDDIDDLIIDLVVRVFGKKQEQKVVLRTPKRWCDWIKEKYKDKKWMKKIIKKYPIRYNYHYYMLSKHTCFPTLDIPPDLLEKNTVINYYWSRFE